MTLRATVVRTLLVVAALAQAARAQDNPILRERLQQKIVEELATHNSQDTAWYNEKRVDKQKWTKGKLLGKPIRLASWTEETKSWVWLEDPGKALSVELRRLAIKDGRVEFALAARTLARYKVYSRIPKFAKGAVGGNMDIELAIEGSAALGGGGLADSKVTTFTSRIHDLRFNNDAAHPLEDLAKDALNNYLSDHNDKFRRSLEKAIDRVKF